MSLWSHYFKLELLILVIETSHIRRKSQIDHFTIFRTPSHPFYWAKTHQIFSEASSTYELKNMIQWNQLDNSNYVKLRYFWIRFFLLSEFSSKIERSQTQI